jgi:hypothetical protein
MKKPEGLRVWFGFGWVNLDLEVCQDSLNKVQFILFDTLNTSFLVFAKKFNH